MFLLTLIPSLLGGVGKFIAANWKPLLVLLIAAALFFAGWHLGSNHVQAAWNKAKAAQAAAVAKVETKQAAVTTRVETQYIDRVQVVHDQGKTIVQQVTKYVPLSTPDLPYGFRLLHDAAVDGVPLPITASGLNGPSVPVAQAASTIIANYTQCRSQAEQLKALQDWVSSEAEAAK